MKRRVVTEFDFHVENEIESAVVIRHLNIQYLTDSKEYMMARTAC